jgi:hypothetical protein
MDPFMESMTFASGELGRKQCDCDECGAIPFDVWEEVRKSKRIRVETGPLKRTQDRKLIQRDQGGIAVWNLVMPLDAEPLIEFGTSHRLVWVKRLPESSSLKAVGKGIIGSSHEEQNRISLPWREGNVYLVQSSGTAVGWVHTARQTCQDDSVETTGDTDSTSAADQTPETIYPRGLATFIIVKIPPEKLESAPLEDDKVQRIKASWVDVARSVCKKSVKESQQDQTLPWELPEADCEKLKEALKSLEEQP